MFCSQFVITDNFEVKGVKLWTTKNFLGKIVILYNTDLYRSGGKQWLKKKQNVKQL